MRKIIVFSILVVLMLMTGCSAKEELTRIDVQVFDKEGNSLNDFVVADSKKLNSIESKIKETKWEPNTKPEMSRKEDVLVSFFISENKNMPERINEYRIWFNKDSTATIFSADKTEGYGTLDKENSEELKKELID